MRILLITPYYYPYNNPRAHRWTSMVGHFLDHGHEVVVVTSADHPNDGSRKETIIRKGASTPDKKLQKDKSPARDFPFRGWLKKLYDMFIWPDESSWWAHGIILEGRQIYETHRPDVLITVSWPFSTHLVGRSFKKLYDIPWLMDIGDPFHLGNWPPRNNQWFYKRRNAETEIELLNLCDAVSVTNGNLASVYDEVLKDKSCQVIGPVGSPLPKVSSDHPPTEEIHIGYFGSFYDGVRHPGGLGSFFSLISRIERKVEVFFFGYLKSHVRKHIQHLAGENDVSVNFSPLIPRNEVISVMSGMDILLSIGNLSVMQLPSKVVDYALSGRPVIHLSEVNGDPVVEFFTGHKAFLEISEEADSDKTAIDFILKSQGMGADPDYVDKVRKGYSSYAIAGQYLQIMKTISSSPAS